VSGWYVVVHAYLCQVRL